MKYADKNKIYVSSDLKKGYIQQINTTRL